MSFLWSVLCTSGHVQVQGWERPAVCRASQDLTLRWQTVLEHRLHLQPSCYRRTALPWVLPKGQRLHFRPLASCTHAAGNSALYFKSRASWHLVANYIAKAFTFTLYIKAALAWINSLPGSSACTAMSFCPCGNYGSSVCVFIFNSLIRAEAGICWATQTVCSCWKWHHGISLLLKNTFKWLISLLLKRTKEPFTHSFHWYTKENCLQPEIKALYMFTSTKGIGSTVVIPGNHSNNNRTCGIKPPLGLFP